jgi:hypothetical protein
MKKLKRKVKVVKTKKSKSVSRKVFKVKGKRGRPRKDIVKELLNKPVVDDFSSEKVTNAWGECIPVHEEDIMEELGMMEGFNTYERYQ